MYAKAAPRAPKIPTIENMMSGDECRFSFGASIMAAMNRKNNPPIETMMPRRIRNGLGIDTRVVTGVANTAASGLNR
jgi:hypothetical protein